MPRLGRAARDAHSAARAERLYERALRRCRIAAVGAQQEYRPAHGLRTLHPEAVELTTGDLLLHHELGHESHAQPGANRPLDRLVGIELPALRGLVARAREVALGHGTRAGAVFAHEQRLAGQARRPDAAAAQ